MGPYCKNCPDDAASLRVERGLMGNSGKITKSSLRSASRTLNQHHLQQWKSECLSRRDNLFMALYLSLTHLALAPVCVSLQASVEFYYSQRARVLSGRGSCRLSGWASFAHLFAQQWKANSSWEREYLEGELMLEFVCVCVFRNQGFVWGQELSSVSLRLRRAFHHHHHQSVGSRYKHTSPPPLNTHNHDSFSAPVSSWRTSKTYWNSSVIVFSFTHSENNRSSLE